MKLTPVIAFALLGAAALLAAQPAPAEPQQEFGLPIGYPASSISVSRLDPFRMLTTTRRIQKGTTEATVLALLGKPMWEIVPGLVQYDNCRPDHVLAEGCRLLIIKYDKGLVAEMTFVNEPMAELVALQTMEREGAPSKALPKALALPVGQ